MTRTSPATAVAEGLAALPEEHRAVLLLARAGHSYREIAERLGVSAAQVRTAALHGLLALTQARLSVPAQAATSAGS
jgi:DNA-directed RNA polymerase specialized sigma24 family protein